MFCKMGAGFLFNASALFYGSCTYCFLLGIWYCNPLTVKTWVIINDLFHFRVGLSLL
jgi:hypothetical protein